MKKNNKRIKGNLCMPMWIHSLTKTNTNQEEAEVKEDDSSIEEETEGALVVNNMEVIDKKEINWRWFSSDVIKLEIMHPYVLIDYLNFKKHMKNKVDSTQEADGLIMHEVVYLNEQNFTL